MHSLWPRPATSRSPMTQAEPPVGISIRRTPSCGGTAAWSGNSSPTTRSPALTFAMAEAVRINYEVLGPFSIRP